MIVAQHRHRPGEGGPTAHPCAIAPHRGDVTTVRAAEAVRLRAEERLERTQADAASHRTAGTASLPVAGWTTSGRVGRA